MNEQGEQKFKLCRNSCCPHLHLNLQSGYARITDDYEGEISETVGQMTCIIEHLKEFLNGDENVCSTIKRVDEFIDIFGHSGGKIRINDNNAQMLIDKWVEAVLGGIDDNNKLGLDSANSSCETVPNLAGSGV